MTKYIPKTDFRHTEETKRKIGLAGKGRAPVNKGKHHTEEDRIKMSESHMGHATSEETRKKISVANTGKVRVYEDLTGQEFGLLTVISFGGRNKFRQITWNCHCKCGKEKAIASYSLKSGHAKSCGHMAVENARKARQIAPGQAGLNRLYHKYNKHANERNLVFEVSKDEFKIITQQECHYCHRLPEREVADIGENGKYIYNGVDRKDNSQGYTIENCLPCCFMCNRMKMNLGYEEFISRCKEIAKNHAE